MFDETPKVGDKIRVIGVIKDINEDTGRVEASYDKVTIVKKKKKNDNNDNDDSDNSDDSVDYSPDMMPESQSLDAALGRAFPNTQ